MFDVGKRNTCFNDVLGNNASRGTLLNFRKKTAFVFWTDHMSYTYSRYFCRQKLFQTISWWGKTHTYTHTYILKPAALLF